MAKKIEKVVEQSVSPEIVDFDHWYSVRKPSIPAHHHKEILVADFRARGLSDNESMASFDEGLKLYGVKLET